VGLLDSLGGRYEPSPVPIEGALGTWTAANTRGGLSLAGGRVILTGDHLVFTPWDMDETREWLFKGLSKAGAPGYVGKIDDLISASKLLEPVAFPVSEIAGTQVLNRASWLKPPTVRITLAGGRRFDLGVLASPGSPNKSRANNQAFDHFLATLQRVGTQAAT
jgi:hypothetical protein